MNFDLTSNVPEKAVLKVEGEMTLNDLNKPCHGVVLWMEYHLTDARTSSGGLVKVSDGRREREGGVRGDEVCRYEEESSFVSKY